MSRLYATVALSFAALTGCSTAEIPTATTPSTSTAALPAAAMSPTSLLVTSAQAPMRLFGSDGKTHLDYDLIVQNVFDAPVTVTSIEVLDGDGTSLQKLDRDQVAAATGPILSGVPPTREVPANSARRPRDRHRRRSRGEGDRARRSAARYLSADVHGDRHRAVAERSRSQAVQIRVLQSNSAL